jgi:hypothetical protein
MNYQVKYVLISLILSVSAYAERTLIKGKVSNVAAERIFSPKDSSLSNLDTLNFVQIKNFEKHKSELKSELDSLKKGALTSFNNDSLHNIKLDILKSKLISAQDSLELKISSINKKLEGMKTLEARLDSLQLTDSIRVEREKKEASELKARINQESENYQQNKNQVTSFGIRTFHAMAPGLGLTWLKGGAIPTIKLDSTGKMSKNDLTRYLVWRDLQLDKQYNYGFFDIDVDSYEFSSKTDIYLTGGKGWSGHLFGGINGLFGEFGTGMGMLQGYCDIQYKKCNDSEAPGKKEGSLIAFTTQVRLGYNYIPSHHSKAFRNNAFLKTLGLGVAGMWRGAWGVAGFKDGEFDSPSDMVEAFYQDDAAFVLGNVYRIEVFLGSYF